MRDARALAPAAPPLAAHRLRRARRPVPPQALDLIRRFESCRLISYRDANGFWTIGWGHKLRDWRDAITQEAADQLLAADAADAAGAVEQLVTLPLPDPQFAALVSFVFNVGAGAFAASHLCAFVRAFAFERAAKEFGRWVHDHHGRVLAGLVERRSAERQLFETPWPTS